MSSFSALKESGHIYTLNMNLMASKSELSHLCLALTAFDSFMGLFCQGFPFLGSSAHWDLSCVRLSLQLALANTEHSLFPLISQPVSAPDESVEVTTLESTFRFIVVTPFTHFLHFRSHLSQCSSSPSSLAFPFRGISSTSSTSSFVSPQTSSCALCQQKLRVRKNGLVIIHLNLCIIPHMCVKDLTPILIGE